MKANSFIKVGDSITENSQFMGCFTNGEPTNFAEYQFLKPLLADFTRQSPDPFTRKSLAARVGIDAEWAVGGGAQSPIVQEIEAMQAAYALTMFGTNTVSRGGDSVGKLDGDKFVSHFKYSWQLVSEMLSRGVIPILMTAPHHRSLPRSEYIIGELNRIVRALAEYHQLPLIDFHHATSSAPDFGLTVTSSGALDVHPRACGSGCDFTQSGLSCGVNMRNLLSMQALSRLRKALDEGQPAPDAQSPTLLPTLKGAGSTQEPYRIAALPFADMRRLSTAKPSALADYAGCKRPAAQAFNPGDKDGPEAVYRLDLPTKKSLSVALLTAEANAFGADASPAQRQLFVLKAEPDGKHCLGFRHTILQNTFTAGTYYLVVDSEGQRAAETPYMLMVSECPADDPACQAHPFISVGPPAQSNDPAANW